MLSKSLIKFSIDGWSCVPSLLFTWEKNYGGGDEDNRDLPQKNPVMYCHSLCPQQATTDPRIRWRLLDTHRQVSCVVTVPFSWVLVPNVLLCPPRVYFPVLCKFWQLYGRVNGDLLQEDLCHTHSLSPYPCGRPLLTCTSTGDAQTQFCLSLCGVPGSWCT